MRTGHWLAAICAFGQLLCGTAAQAQSNNVRISGLSDIAFGNLSDVSDAIVRQSICAYSSTGTNGYHVTATGSGTGRAFTLSNGSGTLPYEVQWSGSSGASSGTNLTVSMPAGGFTSLATKQACNPGPSSSATLIVVVRATSAAAASAGDYAGTLTLVLGPE